MKTRLLKISMLIAGLMFVFTATSWADSGKNRNGRYKSEKRIQAKHHDGRSYHRPAHYRDAHKFNRHSKRFYKKQHDRAHKVYRHKKWVRKHKQYHRNKWIRKHRQHLRHKWLRKHRHYHRHHHRYRHSSHEDYGPYNEFSLAATIFEPGVEFSIGTKRTW